MKKFLLYFLTITATTLPTFGATDSKNNEFLFSVKAKITGYTDMAPGSRPQAKITSPSDCKFLIYSKNIKDNSNPQISTTITDTFDTSVTCPTGTSSITLEFISNKTPIGSPKYNVQNPTHTIELKPNKKNYKLPDIVLEQTNKPTSASDDKKTTSVITRGTTNNTSADNSPSFASQSAAINASNDTSLHAKSTPEQTPAKSERQQAVEQNMKNSLTVRTAPKTPNKKLDDPDNTNPLTETTKKQNAAASDDLENNFDFASASAGTNNTTTARSGLTATPTEQTPEKSERQQAVEQNMKKSLTVQNTQKTPNVKLDDPKLSESNPLAETTKKQNEKAAADLENNFDFASASAGTNNEIIARSGLGATPTEQTPEKSERQQAVEQNMKKSLTVTQKSSVQKTGISQSPAEKERLERTALTKFCKDDGFVYKKNGTETASLGYVKDLCDSKNKVELICYNFKGASIPTEDIIRHFANYCYTNTTNSCESKKEPRPSGHYDKKKADRAAKQEENKIGKRCEIENATSAKYVQKMSGKIVCEPDDCICGYEIIENNFQYSCQKWRQNNPSCYMHESMPDNATKAHYECNKNNKKICVVDDCDYETHYLNKEKNKCIAKSTVKCASNEIVNNVGQCQKNPTDLVKPNDPSKQEMSQADIERDNCVRNQKKNHTKYENNKCVCESADYEMQDDGVCTLKRAKCLEKDHTKYIKGRCVCESDKYEMHSDNNCYMTRAALDAEAAEMEDADNAAKDEQLFLETRKEACAIDNLGEWDEKTGKCKCKTGYKLGDDYACHATNKTVTQETLQALCSNTNGEWDKNKCKCKNETHTFDNEKGCTPDDKKVKRAEKQQEKEIASLNADRDNAERKAFCDNTGGDWNEKTNKCKCKKGFELVDDGCEETEKSQTNTKKKELCEKNGNWNEALKKCNCSGKEFFDEDEGCVAATLEFSAYEKQFNTMKAMLKLKVEELDAEPAEEAEEPGNEEA